MAVRDGVAHMLGEDGGLAGDLTLNLMHQG